MRRTIKFALNVLPEIYLLYACACIAVRLTVRDRYPVGRLAFYAPVFMLAVLGIFGAISVMARKKRRWVALLYLPLMAGLAAFAVSEYQPQNPPVEAEGETIVVFSWNVFHGILGWDEVLREIKARDADIIFIIEAIGEDYSDRPGFWKENFPDYEITDDTGDGDFIILVRGKINKHSVEVSEGLDVVCAELEVHGRRLNVILPHLSAVSYRDSEAIYQRLLDAIDASPKDIPLIVSGDFNTPRNSLYVEKIRQRLKSAHEAAGRGFGYSWPMPFPMWALDHTFVNECLVVSKYRLHYFMLSDHAAQEITLRIKD